MRHSDEKWMAEAIKAGRQARVWSAPNPAVGCVIVRDDELLAAGFTHPTGQQHAEIHALSQIADAAGATAYVTLEPCSHTGHTGPCVDALISAGIVRVVLSCVDPDPRVSGKGVAKLESAGIDVTTGVLEAQAVPVEDYRLDDEGMKTLAAFFSAIGEMAQVVGGQAELVQSLGLQQGLRHEEDGFG